MRASISGVVAGLVFLVGGQAFAAGCKDSVRVSSGATTLAVAELYTSEGCDSCPPADKWFSTLRPQKDGVIPLAFHVDYWDYIGWKDRFAKATFGERQRDLVRRQGGRTSYTPQVMVNGQDQRFWSDSARFFAGVKTIAARTPRANIGVEMSAGTMQLNVGVTVAFPQATDRADAVVYLATTENNLSSRVTAGENRGATLKHDHVVRNIEGPFSVVAAAGGALSVNRVLKLQEDWKRADLTVVAYVQNGRTGEMLQAVAAPVCGSL